MSLYEYDKQLGIKLLCGVDEAGRGPLAGDVYAAAVILPDDFEIEGLNDSKKLSEKKREQLFDQIREKAVSYCVATATVQEIDEHNILQATFMAMRRAVEGLDIAPELVLIDGDKNPITTVHSRSIVKGDSISACIAAASILAKVSRDGYMKKLSEEYPQYLFEKHKGYGTAVHYEKIIEHGVSPIHRTTFLKKFFETGQVPHTKKVGNKGEQAAKEFLVQNGYVVIGTNYSCEHGEIDIIAEKSGIIAIVEVKTRNANTMIAPCQAVSKAKQIKIIKTALMYFSENKMKLQPRFDVIEVFTERGSKAVIKAINHIENAFSAEGYDAFI